MLAVFQLNKSSVRFILRSKEYLRHLITITYSTLGGASLSTYANTCMSTCQNSGTRLTTARSIARLVAQSSTLEVLAGPETRFSTKITRLSAGFGTVTVFAAVLTESTAWRALIGTWFCTLVSTNQGSTAVRLTGRVEATRKTIATCSRTLVGTIQLSLAFFLADLFILLTASEINSEEIV